MKQLFIILFFLFAYSNYGIAQDVINPFAPIKDSIPAFHHFVEQNDLSLIIGDTVTLNAPYIKMPYYRNDETWGVVDSDIYVTYDNISYIDGKEYSETLYYLRDYKNQKPTRFVLCTESEMKSILKEAKINGDKYYFMRPEKYAIIKNKNGIVTLKRVYVPKYFSVQIH